jgi:hypothetical protein
MLNAARNNAAARNAATAATPDANVTTSRVVKEEKDIIIIPMFKGDNYFNWQNAMSAYLEYKRLWSVCKTEQEEPVDTNTTGKTR